MLSYATVQKYLYKIWEIKIQCTWEKYMYKHHYTIYSITGWLKDKLILIWKVYLNTLMSLRTSWTKKQNGYEVNICSNDT